MRRGRESCGPRIPAVMALQTLLDFAAAAWPTSHAVAERTFRPSRPPVGLTQIDALLKRDKMAMPLTARTVHLIPPAMISPTYVTASVKAMHRNACMYPRRRWRCVYSAYQRKSQGVMRAACLRKSIFRMAGRRGWQAPLPDAGSASFSRSLLVRDA